MAYNVRRSLRGVTNGNGIKNIFDRTILMYITHGYSHELDVMIINMGLYRENAIAIESEARYPNDGDLYYVTMQITFHHSKYIIELCKRGVPFFVA